MNPSREGDGADAVVVVGFDVEPVSREVERIAWHVARNRLSVVHRIAAVANENFETVCLRRMISRALINAGIAAALLLPGHTVMAQCTFSAPSAPLRPALVYRFALRQAAETTLLTVTLEFTGTATGVDTLGVPLQWAGQRLHSMRNLHALDAGVEIDTIPGRDARLVRHAPGAPVRIVYELTKDWAGPFDHPYEFHPVILAEYLEVTGDNALAHPRFSDPYTPVVAHFDWSGLPASWALATSFGAAPGASDERSEAKRNDRCQTFAGPWSDVNGAFYAAGDFRVHRFEIGRQPAVLTIRGTYPYSDSAAVAEVQRDVGLVRDFWHDDRFPYFLVTWAPFDRDHNSGDGTAFTNGLWMFVSRLDSLSEQITQLTHEAFHAWDPRRMGRQANSEVPRIGWFHEGFTMFYADAIAYRAGLISLSSVVERVNRDLQNFTGSNDPYVRGDVIARWLDGAIREHSGDQRSLDDVMRGMVRENDQPLTLARILATADRYLATNDQVTLRDLATGTGAPPLTLFAGELAPCVRVTRDSAYAFDAGFDFRASIAARRVTGVHEGSAAFAAGLRDGQPLLGWSIDNGNSEKQATFRIQADSGQRRISYYPRGAGGLLPQLHISDDYAPRPGACGLSIR